MRNLPQPMIVMSGIVVNDAILKVDMMNRLRTETDLVDAIHGGGIRRLRPILMTSLTTILALTPILFSEGLAAGTAASLYFVPVLYAWSAELGPAP